MKIRRFVGFFRVLFRRLRLHSRKMSARDRWPSILPLIDSGYLPGHRFDLSDCAVDKCASHFELQCVRPPSHHIFPSLRSPFFAWRMQSGAADRHPRRQAGSLFSPSGARSPSARLVESVPLCCEMICIHPSEIRFTGHR